MKLSFNPLKLFLISVIILGIFFRFANLDKKVYWIDEVHTSVRVAGYKKTEFVDDSPSDRIIKIADLQTFQHLSPKHDWGDTINALAANAEHTPVYYFLTRIAMQIFGSSVTVTRGVAAVISLFVFPCIYWLSLELFASPLVGWIAMALVAVSPIHVLYAQEAREYSLWTVTILISSLSLLRAIRLKTKFSWGLYAASVALGLYSHLLCVLVFIAHGIYVLVTTRRLIKLIPYILASTVGVISFIPWIILYFINASSVGIWTGRDIGIITLANRWLFNFNATFVDFQIGYNQQLFDVEEGNDIAYFNYHDPLIYLIPVFAILVVYSFYFLVTHTAKPTWLFILILTIIPASGLIIPDILSGGQRSSIPRYLIPTYIGIHLAIAYLFANHLTVTSRKAWKKSWQILLVVVVSAGILSGAVSMQAETWWNKYSSYYNPDVAAIINRTPQPLVISSQKRVSRITSLSYELEPKVRILLVETKIPNIIDGFSDIFLFRPSAELQEKLARDPNYKLQVVHQLGQLWRIQKFKF